jgi:hypothetical protein
MAEHVDTTERPEPVSDHKNEQLHGLALCCDEIHDNFLKDVAKARRKEAEYRASLPTTGQEIRKEALSVLHPRGASHPSGFETAYWHFLAIELIARNPAFEWGDEAPKLVAWLAEQGFDSLTKVRGSLDHLSDVLGKLEG